MFRMGASIGASVSSFTMFESLHDSGPPSLMQKLCRRIELVENLAYCLQFYLQGVLQDAPFIHKLPKSHFNLNPELIEIEIVGSLFCSPGKGVKICAVHVYALSAMMLLA